MSIDLLIAISGLLILALGIVVFGVIVLSPGGSKENVHG